MSKIQKARELLEDSAIAAARGDLRKARQLRKEAGDLVHEMEEMEARVQAMRAKASARDPAEYDARIQAMRAKASAAAPTQYVYKPDPANPFASAFSQWTKDPTIPPGSAQGEESKALAKALENAWSKLRRQGILSQPTRIDWTWVVR